MKKKVLIVETSEEECRTLEKLFSKKSYEVITCSNGIDALKELNKTSVDLAVSNVEQMCNLISEIKENIALSVPHELRTPLVPILGYSEMLLELGKSSGSIQIEEYSLAINKSANRLKSTIEKFLIYSGLHYELPLTTDNCIINVSINYIKAVASSITTTENKKDSSQNIREIFDFNIEESSLKIDESFFDICIKEIIENAIKFSESYPQIIIEGRILEDHYELSISNTGSYFSSDEIKNISIFKQRNPDKRGSGLGLPIVKKIIEFFGGKLKIESEKWGLTTVKLLMLIPK